MGGTISGFCLPLTAYTPADGCDMYQWNKYASLAAKLTKAV